MSYPQPPQGYPAPAQPQQQYAPPMPPQGYADPNAAQQYPPASAYPAPAQQPMPGQYVPQGYPAPAQPQQQYAPAAPEVEDTAGMFGGAPSISWDLLKGYVLGTPRGGQVLSKKVTQQTDQETKALKFFQGSNQPMMQIELTLQTRERTDANDDGKRTMYVKGLMMKDAKTAFEAQGAKDIEISSWFYAANTSKTAGRNGKANKFECVYARPGQPDPLAHLPAYVAPQLATPAQPQQPQFVPPQQPNYPVPGQQPAWNPYGQPPVQGNQYGYGHQPPTAPGGQAYAAAQQPAQGQPQATFAGQPIDPTAGFAQNPPAGGPAWPPAGYNPF